MSGLIKHFGVSAVLGVIAGVVAATWVSPTTNAGIGLIIIVVTFATIVLVEGVRAVAGTGRKSKRQRGGA